MNTVQKLVNAAKVVLTPKSSIVVEIEKLFSSAKLREDKEFEIDTILQKVISGKLRYIEVASSVNKLMPWWCVCLVHIMEAGSFKNPFNFHLHCGDSLTGRTIHVPVGRPKFNPHNGNTPPSVNNPYTWEESAKDALLLTGWDKEKDFSLGNILWKFEKFNGLGYRKYHPEVPTPYLWSYTTVYTKGKYVLDGKFDKNAISRQPGCAAFILRMIEQGVISL